MSCSCWLSVVKRYQISREQREELLYMTGQGDLPLLHPVTERVPFILDNPLDNSQKSRMFGRRVKSLMNRGQVQITRGFD